MSVLSSHLATGNPMGAKQGRSCAKSYLGMVATGDASIAAAAKAGGIKRISYVDSDSSAIFGIVATYCTIVHGE